jgi:hypothetical protein
LLVQVVHHKQTVLLLHLVELVQLGVDKVAEKVILKLGQMAGLVAVVKVMMVFLALVEQELLTKEQMVEAMQQAETILLGAVVEHSLLGQMPLLQQEAMVEMV